MTRDTELIQLRSKITQSSLRNRTPAYIQLVANSERSTCDALKFLSTELRNDGLPLRDRGGADTQRPCDIRGVLKVINNVLLQHETPFTTVKNALQPRYQREALTSVDMDKLSTIAERLTAAMKDAGVSASQLARDCNVSPAAVHKWQHGGKMSADNSASAARALGVREEWLRTGKLPREREHAAQEESVDRVISILEGLREPLAALASAIDQLGKAPSGSDRKRSRA